MTGTVLSVAYPFAPVNRDTAGGAEQVLRMIDEALQRASWKSIVIAQSGSKIAGRLVPLPAFTRIGERERATAARLVRQTIDYVCEAERVDIVHMHGVDFLNYLPCGGPPILATLHLPPEWYSPAAFAPDRSRVFLNTVSHSQYRRCPPSRTIVGTVENGVDIEAASAPRENFALTLGRICPEKGFHLAIDACVRVGLDLVLGGRVFSYEEHERYFQSEILPRLDSRRRFIGPVAGDLKGELLSRARCVLIPSLAPETSSLVAMEALACGTPVIAFASGALPEIVTDGETGFIVKDVAGIADAIGRVDRIDSARCRAEAATRFRASRMTDDYMGLYARLIARAAISR